MFRFIGLCLGTLVRLLRARRSLLLENLALRQQLAVRKRRHPRPRLDLLDKLFWVADWEGCTTGTIGLPNPNRRSVGKASGFLHPYIYRNTARVHRDSFCAF